MAKIHRILSALALILALTNAEPARFRGRTRLFARQEVAPAADAAPSPSPDAAPYPAAGVTPEIPFDLPTETEAPQPDLVYGPPDNTYGPPPVDEVPPQPDNTYGPPDAAEPAAEPDNTYGPPDAVPAIEELAPEEPQPTDATDLVSQNLIQPRHQSRLRSRARAVPQKLRAAPRPARLRAVAPLSNVVEIIRSKPVLVYTLQ